MTMKAVRLILMALGVLFLTAIVGVAAAWTYSRSQYSERIDRAGEKDVVIVLNWGGLNRNQPYKVISSYQSQQSFTGDHEDYFCIQITEFRPDARNVTEWVFGEELNSIIADARRLAFKVGEPANCFGQILPADSSDVAAYIWSIDLHGRFPASANIIFYHRPTNRLLYVSYKT
jgi:hypothetical protein